MYLNANIVPADHPFRSCWIAAGDFAAARKQLQRPIVSEMHYKAIWLPSTLLLASMLRQAAHDAGLPARIVIRFSTCQVNLVYGKTVIDVSRVAYLAMADYRYAKTPIQQAILAAIPLSRAKAY
jgi:hypothetical protein